MESKLDIKIIDTAESISYLEQIKELFGLNKEYLGETPNQVIENSYSRNEVFIAIVDQQFAGYLLYRSAPRYRRYSVMHLCVERHFRGEGISKLLIDRLKDIAIEANFKGINLNCRSDFIDAQKVWEGSLFQSVGKKSSRTCEKNTSVTFWCWKNSMCRELFSSTNDVTNVTNAVLDTNVLTGLKENDSKVMHLLGDSLLNEVDFFVTRESLNEINKYEDQTIKDDMRAYIGEYHQLDFHKNTFNNYVKELKAFLPSDSDQDVSNIKQLAQTLATGTEVFITADEGILASANKLSEHYDLEIFRASELLNYLDKASHFEDYQPVLLSEASIELRQIKAHEIPSITTAFRQPSENKTSLLTTLQESVDDSNACEVLLVSAGKTMLALVAITDVDKNESTINLFRVLDCELTFTLSSQILNFIFKRQSNLKVPQLWIVDKHSSLTEKLADTFGFKNINDRKFKLFRFGSESMANLSSCLDTEIKADSFPSFKLSDLKTVNEAEPFALEKMLWPIKIKDVDVPIYLIPIKAHWAMQLFDEEIASEDIFSPDSSLAFNIESVYYNATKVVMKTPGRIVWYVTDIDSKSPLSGHIRAMSYLDKVDYGRPKSLFRKYKRLGVYDWSEVFKTASNNNDKEICAMVFSRTELLSTPISLDKFNVMRVSLGHETTSLLGPLEIDIETFNAVSESL